MYRTQHGAQGVRMRKGGAVGEQGSAEQGEGTR